MKFFHSFVPGSPCSVLAWPEVYRFMDFLGDGFWYSVFSSPWFDSGYTLGVSL